MGAVSTERLLVLATSLAAIIVVARFAAVNPDTVPLLCSAAGGLHCAAKQASAVLPDDFDMRECYKDEFADVPAIAQDYLNELPSRFEVQLAMFSTRPRIGGLTVVTSGAINRLYMLDTMCANWVGPLAAAVLLPVLPPGTKRGKGADGHLGGSSADVDIDEVIKDIQEVFARAEASKTGCQLDIMFITELAADDLMLVTYPINAARNMAMLLARTELVFPMDIDFLISRDFSDIVLDPARYAELRDLAFAQRVIVPPAYRIEDEALAQTVAAGGRPAALEAFANGTMEKFNDRPHKGHIATDFERWQTTRSSYDIQYEDEFEPWCILARLTAPWFDNRFRGRMKNKVNWFRVINATGFGFTVHRDLYIVHRPHPEVKDNTRGEVQRLWMHNNLWHDDSDVRLKNRTYTAPVTPAFKRCQAQLPWWNVYPADGEPAQYKTVPVPFRNDTTGMMR